MNDERDREQRYFLFVSYKYKPKKIIIYSHGK